MLLLRSPLSRPSALAQQTESRITGRVLDQSQGALPGVTVTVTSKATGAVRTDVTDGEGNYAVTNLGPGTYDVQIELAGFAPKTREVVLGVGQIERVEVELGVAHVQEHVTVNADVAGPRPDLGEDWRQRFARGSREPPGQRPQLRQPDDARDRRDQRWQRRMGVGALQRQVEPAELPELRRRRRHLRVGREPRLPELNRLAVPPADVDGIGRGVPRQLGPRAGRERPRRRRQHHRRQQERQQRVPRVAVRLHPQRRAGFGDEVRRRRRQAGSQAAARSEPVRRLDWRPAEDEQVVLLLQLRGPAADHRPDLHGSRAERRDHPPHPGRRTGRQRRRPESRAHAGGGAAP